MKMKAELKVGDLIWARFRNNPMWPARIESLPTGKKGKFYVFYFGSKPNEEYGWVAPNSILEFNHKSKPDLVKASTWPSFKLAVEQIEAEYKKKFGSDEATAESASEKVDAVEPQLETLSKRTPKPKKRFDIENDQDPVPPSSAKGKRKRDSVENGGKSYKVKILKEGKTANVEDIDPKLTENSDLTVLDFGTDEDALTSPTKIIGFLGLGIMGSRMVNNLIKTGHKVNIWNRSVDKSEAFKQEADKIHEGRVNICMTPSDVVNDSDIIFSCFSDPESAAKMISENCGVVRGVETLDKKGFVEMTGIDPQTSKTICNHIEEKGGRYLEAQLQGSRNEAENGTLIILAAGNNSLFMDCQSCFRAIGKSSFFMGDVGVASKVQLILQLMQGISLVGLAEGLVLADRCGISGKDFIEIFNITNMASPYLSNKATKIVSKDFKKVEQSLQNMQKDIRLALGISDELMQPLMMASAANEVFKHSRKLGYDEHDCSCVYMKARY